MNFVTIDDKKQCVSVFFNDSFHKPQILENIKATGTWSYSPYLEDLDVEYAQIYNNGKSFSEACPDSFRDEYEIVLKKIESYFVSFRESKLNPNKICLYDLIPEKLLKQFFVLRLKIIEHVFNTAEKPKNYDFHLGLHKLVKEISLQKLNIDCDEYPKYIKYVTNASITNRLKTTSNSFPILHISKENRKIIKPRQDYFVELDFNGADLRTALGLLDIEQPETDIVAWLGNKVWGEGLERSEIKKEIYSWMYNPERESPHLDKVLDRDKILGKYWDGQQVTTLMGEVIQADKKHALSYLVQSSTHELFFDRVLKLREFLKNKKSFIAFCIHDSVVLDLHNEDRKHMSEIRNIFSNTLVGQVKVNISASKQNFGSMKTIC